MPSVSKIDSKSWTNSMDAMFNTKVGATLPFAMLPPKKANANGNAIVETKLPEVTTDEVTTPANPPTKTKDSDDGRHSEYVKLVGLPFDCGLKAVKDFMGGFKLYPFGGRNIFLMKDKRGRESCKAMVRLISCDEARRAAAALHKQYMGWRYIEVYHVGEKEVGWYNLPLISQQSNTTTNNINGTANVLPQNMTNVNSMYGYANPYFNTMLWNTNMVNNNTANNVMTCFYPYFSPIQVNNNMDSATTVTNDNTSETRNPTPVPSSPSNESSVSNTIPNNNSSNSLDESLHTEVDRDRASSHLDFTAVDMDRATPSMYIHDPYSLPNWPPASASEESV